MIGDCLRGSDIFEKLGITETWRRASDSALELYLLDLALQKKVIEERLREAIRVTMQTEK